MLTLLHKQLIIEIANQPIYAFDATDNIFNYAKTYCTADSTYRPTSQHDVKIYEDGKLIASCIVIGFDGGTGIHKTAALVDGDVLLLCCSNTIFCFNLPHLNLQWKTKADPVTCFQIIQQADNYLIHGEVQITKLDKRGAKIWEFFGADIFITMDKTPSFIVENHEILLTDFSGNKYTIDFDGRLIEIKQAKNQ